MQVAGVSGSPVQVQGEFELNLEIGGVEFLTEVLVADIMGVQGILGMPFLKSNQCVIDVGKGTLQCHEHEWELCHLPSLAGVQLSQ